MVSGSFSLLCSRFFSPFLHSTGSLSVSREYLALRDGPRRFAPDFSCPGLLRCPFDFLRISLTGLSPSMATISIVFCYARSCLYYGSFYPDGAVTSSVWALPRSLAATYGIDVSFFSSGYLDVSVPRVPLHTLWIGVWMIRVLRTGFPHSDICGSRIICISPQLFAAYHVFLRLLVPRHPPCALFCLTSLLPFQ